MGVKYTHGIECGVEITPNSVKIIPRKFTHQSKVNTGVKIGYVLIPTTSVNLTPLFLQCTDTITNTHYNIASFCQHYCFVQVE